MIENNVEEFINDVTADNSLVESRPIVIPKKDIKKKHKRKRKKKDRQETGFICDDFEILI